MSKRKDAWNTKKNAAGYDAYASKFSLYKETSRDLVEIANITSGMTVVDLAAGTGVTTEAVLEQTDNDVTVIAVDQAEEMLKKARERHSDKGNVTYVVAQAESLEKSISDKVDAVICNSAFWQMVPRHTKIKFRYLNIVNFRIQIPFLETTARRRVFVLYRCYFLEIKRLWKTILNHRNA
jgi:ubiquinone/menaquinone biosynthesis C-methylase UbiE